MVQDFSRDWSAELQLAASAYMADHRLEPAQMLRVDVVLMLLRIGTGAARLEAQALAGLPITHCPAAIPPWPPRPVAKRVKEPVVVSFTGPGLHAGTAMAERYRQVKRGMTKEQLLARGCTQRDIRYWCAKGRVTFGRTT